MGEYIEREAATNVACNILWKMNDLSTSVMAKALNSIPTADVAPVRHGRWERTADGAALCTACKRKMNPSQYGYAFCSLCGAKMDGGED